MNKIIKLLIINIIFGFIFSFSFPKYDVFPLAWFCIIPLILVIDENPLAAFLIGLTYGLSLNIGLLYWISIVIKTYSSASFLISVLIMLLLCFYLSLYWGIWAAGGSYLKRKFGNFSVWFLPFLLVALEYIKNYLLTGFPWCLVGYSQHRFNSLCQIASITGIYGISFIIILSNIILSGTIMKKLRHRNFFLLSAISLILIIGIIIWGRERINNFKPQGESIPVGIIQGNIPQDIKWEPNLSEQHFQKHILLTKIAVFKGAKFIIWPEAAVTFFIAEDFDKYSKILKLVEDAKIHLFFGGDYREMYRGKYRYYNAAIFISYPNFFIEKYAKMHLVPFGEYVPLRKVLFFIDKLVEGMEDFTPGREYKIFKINSSKFGCMICYEIIFPEISKRFVKEGAELLVTITNDAWFGKTSAPYQHYAMAKIRAIENSRYLIRAANTGISGIINPVGVEIKKSGLFTDEVIIDKIYFSNEKTMYFKYGDWLCFLSIFLIAFLILLKLQSSKVVNVKHQFFPK